MKPMKFSFLTFSKIFVYLIVLLGIFAFVLSWFTAPWEEILQKWESVLAMFAFILSVATYIIKQIAGAKRLNYQPDRNIFIIEKLVWYQFKWLPEKQFTYDEILGVCEISGSIYLIDKNEQICVFLGETSDSSRAKMLCQKIAYKTRLYFLDEKTLHISGSLKKENL
ncbi:hypothetical protein ACKLNO_10725 [Neisseriaceae bacterium B1]